jgi:proteic killer suppression protein
MIRSFRDKDLETFWLSKGKSYVKCVPSELRKAAYRKLRELNNAQDTRDLRKTPSNHLEKLTGKHHFGYSSIRINDQYRLIFLWKNNHDYEVEINKHGKKF